MTLLKLMRAFAHSDEISETPTLTSRFEDCLKKDPHQTALRSGEEGYTPLHQVAEWNLPEVASLLLRYGADPNARTVNGDTPMHTIMTGDKDEFSETVAIAKALLKHGADPNAENMDGISLLYLAVHHVFPCIAKLLEDHGAKLDLNSAVLLGRVEDVKSLLSRDPAAVEHAPRPSELAQDALRMSEECEKGRAKLPRILELLLDNGLSANTSCPGGIPLLRAACEMLVKPSVIQTLVDHGADVNAVHAEETALDCARPLKNRTYITLLRRAGAKRGQELSGQAD